MSIPLFSALISQLSMVVSMPEMAASLVDPVELHPRQIRADSGISIISIGVNLDAVGERHIIFDRLHISTSFLPPL